MAKGNQPCTDWHGTEHGDTEFSLPELPFAGDWNYPYASGISLSAP
jgi:hypothetical protein